MMSVARVKAAWSAISAPWSQVMVEYTARGRESTMLLRASVTVRVRWLSARRVISTNRLVRSTRVIRALRPPAPMTRSPSQCPGTALSSASGGRRLMVAPWIQLLPLGSGFSGQWGAEVCGGCVRCAGPSPPATGRAGCRRPGRTGPGRSARDRCACSHHRGSRTAGGRRSARGPAPIPRAGRRPARAGPDWRPAPRILGRAKEPVNVSV